MVHQSSGYELYNIQANNLNYIGEKLYTSQESIENAILVDNYLITTDDNNLSIVSTHDLKYMKGLTFNSKIRLYKPREDSNIWYIIQTENNTSRILQCKSMSIESELKLNSEISSIYCNKLK